MTFQVPHTHVLEDVRSVNGCTMIVWLLNNLATAYDFGPRWSTLWNLQVTGTKQCFPAPKRRSLFAASGAAPSNTWWTYGWNWHKHKVGIRLFKDNQATRARDAIQIKKVTNLSFKSIEQGAFTQNPSKSLNSRIPTLCLPVWCCCDMDCLADFLEEAVIVTGKAAEQPWDCQTQ